MSSALGVSSSSFKQPPKKITSHTISISGKQEISLTKSHGVGTRPSLLPGQNSLSKVAGVSHLSEKSHNGVGGNLMYLQKSQNLSISTQNNNRQKRDANNKNNVNGTDYYTVQNTRNPSIQNSSQQTSRNQNHLVSHQVNPIITLNPTEQEASTPVMNQNRSMRSPPRSGQSSKPLEQIQENPNTSQTLSDFSKVYSYSQVKSTTITTANLTNSKTNIGINRHSVINADKSYPRATSVVKNNVGKNTGLLLQKTFNQMTNFNKSQNTKKLGQITINSNLPISSYGGVDTSTQLGSNTQKQQHKKSVLVVQHKDQYSPKVGTELNKHTLFKSPQITTKKSSEAVSTMLGGTGKNQTQVPSVFISNSNSPMPQPPSSSNNQKIMNRIQGKGQNDRSITSQTRLLSTKLNKHTSANANNNQQSSTTSIHNKQANMQQSAMCNKQKSNTQFSNSTPSCLQIDLSNLSVKPEDEGIQVYQPNNNNNQQSQSQNSIIPKQNNIMNSTASQNAQVLFSGSQINKSNQRKQSSQSQTKKTTHSQYSIVSQSPSTNKNMHGSSQMSGKSPKTKGNNPLPSTTNQRHSLLTGQNKSKTETSAKIIEPIFSTQKSNTQKLQNKNTNTTSSTYNNSKTQQTVKSQVPFEKKKQFTDRVNSIEGSDDTGLNQVFEIKHVVVSSKVKTSQSLQSSSVAKKQNKGQESKKQSQLPGKELEDDNFSFNSQNNKSILDSQLPKDEPMKLSDLNGTTVFDQVAQEDNLLAVSEEQSNLRSHRSQALLQVQSTKSITIEEKNTARNYSKVGSQAKIHLNLDDSLEEKDSNKSPTKEKFLQRYESILFEYEKKEIKELKENKIYFPGILITERTSEDLETSRMLQSEEEMLKSLDDEEGYYNVVLNDHLNYRYEILKILGKGSFAQVVCCFDHKLKQKVAIKITRNTEIDHKFASSESKLLNFLMNNDPNDSHNVVRMTNEFYFRDHHCFVFELLHSDLFEHLKENGFIGFEVSKIRDYAMQILEALIFLEKHKIIHCDLKPENILLRDEECQKLKLVDYGSGCFRSEQVYTYVQSRFYRAPEVILRIPYSEKVDIWSFGCILAELYTGEPLFPGNNEQEQLELIMEICGIPSEKVIDQSRKKDHYFDVDYSPFLIEDEEMGILRIPESRRLEDAVPCQDELFIDFMKKCLELDPELRFSASQAMQHKWIQAGILQKKDSQKSIQLANRNVQSQQQHTRQESSNHLQLPNIMVRRREDQQDGVKGQIYEESPQRPIKEKPKKSLTKHFNFQTIKVGGINDADSLMSTPKNEGGVPKGDESRSSVLQSRCYDSNFQMLINKEQIINEEELNKPHNISMINKNINNQNYASQQPPATVQDKDIQKVVKIVGKYEIVRADEEQKINVDTNSQTSGIAIEANIPPVNQHETTSTIINNENAINKITVTFYQKRQNNSKNQSHNPHISGSDSNKNSGAQDKQKFPSKK